jgi:hypothetical protein
MDEEEPSKPVPEKPSEVPSWVTLGFVLGALFVLALPKREQVPPTPQAAVEEARPAAERVPEAPRLTTIEAVFSAWDKYAVWSNDTTEVALWDPATKSFSECYEVIRNGSDYYVRSIPFLTRPLLTHGVPENSPLAFTETARQRQEWLEAVNKETWKALAEGARDALAPATAPGAAPAPKPADGK